MQLVIPDLAMVVLVGASGAGKSTFARRHFLPTEVLSSDAYRAVVSDDENDQSATGDAFAILHAVAARRLARGRLVVVDATNVRAHARKSLLALSRTHHCASVAIVFAVPDGLCLERNQSRTDRRLPEHVLAEQAESLRRSLDGLEQEGFLPIHVLTSLADVDDAVICRQPMPADRRSEHGGFDVVGGINGCYDELLALLRQLGYGLTLSPHGQPQSAALHPEGRRAVFVGNLVGSGPRSLDCLLLATTMCRAGAAFCVPGDLDDLAARSLRGEPIPAASGLGTALAQLAAADPTTREEITAFLKLLPSHLVLNDGKLVVAHAGLPEHMHGRSTAAVDRMACYGASPASPGPAWTAAYRGKAVVVHAAAPTREPTWLHNTLSLDTGCVLGGKLSAIRYPELEVVAVAAIRR